MKIAIPTRNNEVDDHFGHCEYYTIFESDEQKNVISKELFRTQSGCGCKSNVAGILKEMGVTIMLAGNIGQGALNMLSSYGIEVIRGCKGTTDELLKSFFNGALSDEDIICHQHNCHTES